MNEVENIAMWPKLAEDLPCLHESAEAMFVEIDQQEATKCPQQTTVKS